MVRVRHFLFKEDRIKQLLLIPLQPTHHGPFPPLTASTSENHCSRKHSTDFCNKICQYWYLPCCRCWCYGAVYSNAVLRPIFEALHAALNRLQNYYCLKANGVI